MQAIEKLPRSIQDVHNSLGLYLRERQEAANIRQILASYLGRCLDQNNQQPVSRPLSIIIDASLNTETAISGVRGIRRDYLRSVKANVRARKDYDTVLKEHCLLAIPEAQTIRPGTRNLDYSTNETPSCLNPFIELVKIRRKNDRLQIYKDYLDTLARKPAADATNFESEGLLKLKSLPEVPPEIMNALGTRGELESTDLEELVSRLEKSVLRAQLLLKKEQKFLAKLKNNNSSAPTVYGDKLEALGMTRNELINWIETELGKTNESPEDDSGQEQILKPDSDGEKLLIERHIISIQKQYSQYAKAREALIRAATGKLAPPSAEGLDRSKETSEDKSERAYAKSKSYIAHSYLEELAFISNEQKSVLQQRSHLTTSLAKQIKETIQGLDLLAEESHLLPVHPSPAESEAAKSFADEMLNLEKPDSSRKAKEWIFATASAGVATRSAISRKLEEGEAAVSDSQKALSTLQELLGAQVVDDDGGSTTGVLKYENVWEILDGQLGVIKGDDLSTSI